jgi:hypothetical protein
METAARALIRWLDDQCWVTGSNDAYPADHGIPVSTSHAYAINHRADAFVWDAATGNGFFIDYTFTDAAKSEGKDGALPGGQADIEEDRKMKQYGKQFPSLTVDSSPALVILSMERHGSWSKGTCEFWKARVHNASTRGQSKEFPIHKSVITRRVLQTLAVALQRCNALRILQLHRRAYFGAQRGGARAEDAAPPLADDAESGGGDGF